MSAADVGDDGNEKPRLHAVGKVPTVAAMGSRAPKGAATKHTEQSAHQAAIWVALEYAGQCLAKGSKVTLTVESATALRNLHDAPADEEAGPGAAAQGGVAAQTPHRDGAARPMPGDGNKRQRPNPRPDLKRGREAEERAAGRAASPSHTKMNTTNKRRLEALMLLTSGPSGNKTPLPSTERPQLQSMGGGDGGHIFDRTLSLSLPPYPSHPPYLAGEVTVFHLILFALIIR